MRAAWVAIRVAAVAACLGTLLAGCEPFGSPPPPSEPGIILRVDPSGRPTAEPVSR